MRKSLILLAALASVALTAEAASAGGKPGKIQVGGNVVVTPTQSSRGSVPIQTGPNVVINPITRPTGPGGPCTVHCGPLGGRGKR
jgi:hypothetical protein